MKSYLKGLVLALALAPLVAAASASAADATLACEAGPIQRQVGASTWNIYACSDDKSAVVVPVKVVNGEAGYFFVTPNGQGISVAGEGWGKDAAFQRVYKVSGELVASAHGFQAGGSRFVRGGRLRRRLIPAQGSSPILSWYRKKDFSWASTAFGIG